MKAPQQAQDKDKKEGQYQYAPSSSKNKKNSSVASSIQAKIDLNKTPYAQEMINYQQMADNSPQVKAAIQMQAVSDAYVRANDPFKNQGRLHEQHPMQRQIPEKTKNETGLPDNLKIGIENFSRLSMDDVSVHYNSSKPEQFNALAYTQGTDIYVTSGQERHLPHEAWHVVQQKQGRVKATTQMQGIGVNNDVSLEKEADVMGIKANKSYTKDSLLNGSTPTQIDAPLVAQCLPKFKNEEEAIIYFEDTMLDDMKNHLQDLELLKQQAKQEKWNDLLERIHYYTVEASSLKKMSSSEKETIFNFDIDSIDLDDPGNLIVMLEILEKIQEQGEEWSKLEDKIVMSIRKLEDERDDRALANRKPKKPLSNKEMKGDTLISQIVMLGAHDAGTSNIKHCKGISVCQDLDLVEQAKQGVQYFDLRVRKNRRGDWKFYHGERSKALGGFNASESAISQLDSLYDYAKKDTENLFIFKFHFDKGKDGGQGGQKISTFLKAEVVDKLKGNLIKRRGDSLLGESTIADTVHSGKNIGILAHHTGEQVLEEENIKDYLWPYSANTYGGWGKTPDSNELIEHLTENIRKENTEKKMLISQTNLPAAIPPSFKVLKNPAAWKGLKHLASRSHKTVAEGVQRAVGDNEHSAGVISMDFVGTDKSSTAFYAKLRDRYNEQFRK